MASLSYRFGCEDLPRARCIRREGSFSLSFFQSQLVWRR